MAQPEIATIGPWQLYPLEPENGFESDGEAWVVGDLDAMSRSEQGPVIRVHSQCLFGEVFGSLECECGPQLAESRRTILLEGSGILFYLHQEGRGAGLMAKAIGYALHQRFGVDSGTAYEMQGLPIDQRQYGHVARFLVEHDIKNVRILTNSPDKIAPLEAAGIACIRLPLIVGVNSTNWGYMQWKEQRGHLLDGMEAPDEAQD